MALKFSHSAAIRLGNPEKLEVENEFYIDKAKVAVIYSSLSGEMAKSN